MSKLIVSVPGGVTDEKNDRMKQTFADLFHVLPEDVVIMPGGASASYVEIPHELTAKRDKADKEAEKEAERVRKEAEKEEKKAHRKGLKTKEEEQEELDRMAALDENEKARREAKEAGATQE